MFDVDCNLDNLNLFPFDDDGYKKAFCNVWVATAIIGASIGGLASAYGASRAASAQTAAANTASQTALGMYNTTRGDLAPYRAMGVDAGNRLGSKLDYLTDPIVMDQNALEQTPGYQFTRRQGLKAVNNSAAARGLGGGSGAALRGAATFATGLADQTYQTQFNIENTNRTNAFNRLKSLIDTGENAGAQTGALGEKAAYNSAQATIGGGNAQAAGYNAIGGAGANVANNIAGYGMYRGLYGNGPSGGNNSGGGGPSYDPSYNAT